MTRTMWFATALVALYGATAAGSPPSGSPLVTTEIRLDHAALVAADTEGTWTFSSINGGKHSVMARKVVRWGRFASATGGHRLRLRTGGEIAGYSVEIRTGDVALTSDLLDSMAVPRHTVAAVIVDIPAEEAAAQALDRRIATAPVGSDTLLFTNGDQLTGDVAGLVKDQLSLKTADADIQVDRSRVAAVVFRRATQVDEHPVDQLRTWVGLRDGSRLLARRFVTKQNEATIELAAGGTVALKIDTVSGLQPLGGEVVYLSDLGDAGYRHIPFLSLAWEYRRDKNVMGGPLVADGERHLKGLGMHSAARVTYNLDRDYREFRSELAIDDSTRGGGSAICRVFADDGSGKWQLKYESPVVRGGEKPIRVNADLTGKKRLSLLVDFADRADQQDHVNWLDARLVR